jgi:hypothetical protein
MVGALIAALRPRASLVVENLALRQQLAVLQALIVVPSSRRDVGNPGDETVGHVRRRRCDGG